MIAFIAIGLAAAPDMTPIDIPYQIMPAYSAYTQCVSAHLRADPHFESEDATLLHEANGDALAACRDVRRQQLAHALELMTDYRLYGNRERAQAAVRRAFDRFDSDYATEPIVGPATSPSQPQSQEDLAIKCAFEHARQLAAASSDRPEVIADKVVTICAPAGSGDAPETGFTRFRIRAAATAMVKRLRGIDGQPADAPFRLPDEKISVAIPDELVPAIFPYLMCLNASAGIPMYKGNREAVIPPPPGIGKGSDCTGMRREAARRGDELLKARGHGDAAERQAFIERELEQVDNFAPRTKPSSQPQN